ncbi:esterase/lipase family protein [Paenibacillus elgii]
MKKRVLTLLLSCLLLWAVVAAPASAAAPEPNLSGVPGTWAPGATPSNLNPNYPVLLFVQGFISNAGTWYKTNDMYQEAYNNGYQTAFVELYDSGGPSKNMWDNGKLLADKIVEISKAFPGKKLVIVAHSKGGVDSQTALVHYGAYPYVSHLVTLGSPHHGSQLADLAYSNWAEWLVDLIGLKTEGTYSLQTSYMKHFRSITDSHANASKNKIYTFAGDVWYDSNPIFLAGGLYLSIFGSNDGVVTVSSAHHPKGSMVKIGPWDHKMIHNGTPMFPLIKPYLTVPAGLAAEAEGSRQSVAQEANPLEWAQPGSTLIRGGKHESTAAERFLVENDVRSITFDWIADQPADRLELIAPNGEIRTVDVKVEQDQELFKSAWHHTAVVAKPEQGEWTLQAQSKKPGAHLLTVQYDSALSDSLKLTTEDKQKFLVETDGNELPSNKLDVRYNVRFIPEQGNPGKKQIQPLKQQAEAGANNELDLTAAQEPGVYQTSVEVQGVTAQGVPFERSLLRSVYVDKQGGRH